MGLIKSETGLLCFTLLSIVLALSFGTVEITLYQLYQCAVNSCSSELNHAIVWDIRLPRVLGACFAGAGLALAGAVLQNTTHNPLADPYLFGIVAGAGLGATIATSFGFEHQLSLPLAAFLGALLSVISVFVFGIFVKRIEQLLLAGVATSFMLGALSHFILYLGEPLAVNRVMFWLMGILSQVSIYQALMMLTVILIAFSFIFAFHRHLDALALGDESALALGVNVRQLRLLMLIICAALTSVIVAYCGGIAFVGLMIPHIARYLVGNNTIKLIVVTTLLGGCFLIWLDVIARSAFADLEIPIGVLTSALGSVFFLIIMYKGNQQHG